MLRARTVTWLAALLAGAGTACDRRPQAIVLCHNGNCAHATDPALDDTLPRLDASLQLMYLGRPAIDGVEIDTLWDGRDGRCLFAHDFESISGATVLDAAERIGLHLSQPTEFVSWAGNRFTVLMELKGEVTPEGARHTPEQLAGHHACVLAVSQRLIEVALTHERALELLFQSDDDAAIVRGLLADPAWPGKDPAPTIQLRLVTEYRADGFTAADGFAGGDGIDIVAFHSTREPEGAQQSLDAIGVPLLLWMLDASLKSFYAIESYRPEYVLTSEASLMRRWMEE